MDNLISNYLSIFCFFFKWQKNNNLFGERYSVERRWCLA